MYFSSYFPIFYDVFSQMDRKGRFSELQIKSLMHAATWKQLFLVISESAQYQHCFQIRLQIANIQNLRLLISGAGGFR